MTEQEAKDWLKVLGLPFNNVDKRVEAIEMAIKALDKQIEKKPLYSKFEENGFGKIIPYEAQCPTCGYEFEFGTFNEEENHHCVCGQKLDWSN